MKLNSSSKFLILEIGAEYLTKKQWSINFKILRMENEKYILLKVFEF